MYQFFVPTRVLFGTGVLSTLHTQALPGKNALLLISNGKSTKENGSLARTQEQLSKAGVAHTVFDKIEANPLKSTVMAGAAACRESRCDFIVALGGGSVLDASKAIAAMATNEGDLWDYVGGGTGKGKALHAAPLPIVAITTTAGTGSEVDAYGVISNEDTQEKIGFGGDDRLFPALAVVDAELMKTVPPLFTAYQGFDALFHATEVYMGKFANQMSDMVAKTAIKNVGRYLARAVQNGEDMEAREQLAFANTMAGYAMVAGCTTSQHSIEHAMSAYHHALPHGAGLIMLSKAYHTRLIEKGAAPGRFVQMAKWLGNKNATEAMDFVRALDALQQACGVANLKMSYYGITPDEFPGMARNSRATMGGLFAADPVELADEDVVAILENAYH